MGLGIHFCDQSGKSYYCNSIQSFLCDKPNEILGSLTKYGAKYGFDSVKEQIGAWNQQIALLQQTLANAGCSGDIIFEYDIVRMGKRIDVVLLIKHMVFSLEFKNGAKSYLAQDADQAVDYALNLKNFHKESENLYVCPVLIATEASDHCNQIGAYADGQIFLQYANKSTMMNCIQSVYEKYGTDEAIDFEQWYNSPYCPTPTIIEAAIAAYRDNTVSEIAHSEAGQADIDACEREINRIVSYAKEEKKKCICFITGVPGAGKTLVGLDLASRNLSVEDNTKAVYLSGNGALVSVLRKALIDNSLQRLKDAKEPITKEKRKGIETAISAFIQEAYRFRKDNMNHPNEEPPENVIIFDEAQRCWNKEKLSAWTDAKMGKKISKSEPEYFIEVMDRKKDWAVIICLVGLGQDIYDGEVGINEWFRSSIEDFHDWEIFYSPKIFTQVEDKNIDRALIENSPKTHAVDELHLSTSIRSFRSEKQSQFIDALLANHPEIASQIYAEMKDVYPIYITRDLQKAKDHVRSKVRGSQRCGLIASSSAKRLVPEGIFITSEKSKADYWFLAPKKDLRSSNALEVVATEFEVQGLEVDYAIVCWDADLRRKDDGWSYYNFKGTAWQKRNHEAQKRYLLNSYRVLLTRARQGIVIFVPKGVDPEIDETRNHKYYDEIYNYLHVLCGIEEL